MLIMAKVNLIKIFQFIYVKIFGFSQRFNDALTLGLTDAPRRQLIKAKLTSASGSAICQAAGY